MTAAVAAVPNLPESWVGLAGLALILAFMVWQTINSRKVGGKLDRVETQVTNDHRTNLRDDLTAVLAKAEDAFRLTKAVKESVAATLDTEIKSMREDIRTEIKGMREDIRTLSSRTEGIYGDFRELRGEVSGLREEVKGLERRVVDCERSRFVPPAPPL